LPKDLADPYRYYCLVTFELNSQTVQTVQIYASPYQFSSNIKARSELFEMLGALQETENK
jgi:hypothetical protein